MRFVPWRCRADGELGFRTVNEMVGQPNACTSGTRRPLEDQGRDLSAVLYQPPHATVWARDASTRETTRWQKSTTYHHHPHVSASPGIGPQDHGGLSLCATPSARWARVWQRGHPSLGSEGLPEDTHLDPLPGLGRAELHGLRAQGITFVLEGDANDYLARPVSGKLILRPPLDALCARAERDRRNVALYGAPAARPTFAPGGRAFLRAQTAARTRWWRWAITDAST